MRLGIPRLYVLPTLITFNLDAAYGWAKRLGKPIVYKPMSGVFHADEGQVRVMFTKPVTELESLLDPAVARTAQLFQTAPTNSSRHER
jgi:glutathione synthase/RimK-type ligase-like ATP-grasp enzyme